MPNNPSPSETDPNLELRETLSKIVPSLDRITAALEKLASQGEQTTQNPPLTFNQFVETQKGSLDTHPGEEPVDDDDENVIFADGRTVPKDVIDAMVEFEQTWPGAVPKENARAALAWHILNADQKHKKKVKDDSSGS